ncbi:MAG: LptF/LptG family permease, partial [Oligoflexus sp.]
VIVVSQLVRLSEVLVTFGLSLENILLPFLFILMPFISIIVPIALLFAILLAFSRISADGEYAAMLASGYSLQRALLPVLTITAAAWGVATVGAVYFESWGRRETIQFYHRKTQTELDNMIRYQMKEGVFLDDFLGYVLYAETISPDRTRFENVMLAPGRESQTQHFTLLAPAASITGSVEHGDLRMAFDYGLIYSTQPDDDSSSVVKFKRAELDLLRIFRDQIFGAENPEDDYRSYTPQELWGYIDTVALSNNPKERENYLKARYLFHQRFSMPFAAVIFALLAMVFGIHDERRGKSYGFLAACLSVVVGYVVMMSFKFLAEKGLLSAPLAAWLPNLILLSFAAFLLYQKNRLPPSESVFDLRHIPGLRNLRRHAKMRPGF